jgi:dephospho-CoA kinase
VHELYAEAGVRDAVVARLGDGVLDAGGGVDRAAVARAVFGDDEQRAWLEGLLWPLVGERVRAFRAAAAVGDPPPAAIVIETPLLFEAGMDAAYDATIAVIADDDLRARRAGVRGHEGLAGRERRQLGQDEKARRATFVVRNCGGIEELELRLGEVLDSLRKP